MKFVIDGTIGSGKSTVLRSLESLGYPVFQEPLELWTPMMDLYYKDPKKHAFTVNSVCLHDLFHRDLNASGPSLSFHERSIHTARSIFHESTFLQGLIDTEEYKTYEKVYKVMCKSLPRHKFIHIWIDVDPDVAIERMKKRNGSENSLGDTGYFYEINERYREFYKDSFCSRVDGNQEPEKVLQDILSVVQPYLPSFISVL